MLLLHQSLEYQMIDCQERRVRHRHHSFLLPTMPHDASVPRPQRAALNAGRGPGGFAKGRS